MAIALLGLVFHEAHKAKYLYFIKLKTFLQTLVEALFISGKAWCLHYKMLRETLTYTICPCIFVCYRSRVAEMDPGLTPVSTVTVVNCTTVTGVEELPASQ